MVSQLLILAALAAGEVGPDQPPELLAVSMTSSVARFTDVWGNTVNVRPGEPIGNTCWLLVDVRWGVGRHGPYALAVNETTGEMRRFDRRFVPGRR